MKSLNLRFADANVKAMNDLVRAGFYGSIADVVRAAVRDLLMREYYSRQQEIEHMIQLSGGSREDTYGQGDRAKHTKKGVSSVKVAEPMPSESDLSEIGGDPVAIGGGIVSQARPKPSVTYGDGREDDGSHMEGE